MVKIDSHSALFGGIQPSHLVESYRLMDSGYHEDAWTDSNPKPLNPLVNSVASAHLQNSHEANERQLFEAFMGPIDSYISREVA